MKKALVLLLIFVSFFLLAQFISGKWGNQSLTQSASSVAKVVDCEANEVSKLTINANTSKQVFFRSDKPLPGTPASAAYEQANWHLSGEFEKEANKSLLMKLASLVCGIYPSQLLPDTYANLQYGNGPTLDLEYQRELASKTIHFSFTKVDADKNLIAKIVLDGNQTKFVKFPFEAWNILNATEKDLLNFQVFKSPLSAIMAASFLVDGKELFTLERHGAGWRIVRDGKQVGIGGEKAGQFINRYGSLRGIEVLEWGLTPERCERLGSSMHVSITGLSNLKEDIYFSVNEKQNTIVACSTLRKSKFKIHHDFLKFYKTTSKELLNQ